MLVEPDYSSVTQVCEYITAVIPSADRVNYPSSNWPRFLVQINEVLQQTCCETVRSLSYGIGPHTVRSDCFDLAPSNVLVGGLGDPTYQPG